MYDEQSRIGNYRHMMFLVQSFDEKPVIQNVVTIIACTLIPDLWQWCTLNHFKPLHVDSLKSKEARPIEFCLHVRGYS